MNNSILSTPFKLPCGVEIPNRIVKSAMSENMAASKGRPSEKLIHLYERWGRGGAGVLVSGNVMMDHKAVGEPHNVIIEDERYLKELKKWATKCQSNGSHLWMQINHPGRQAPRINKEVVSASDVRVKIGKMYAVPRPLEGEEIWQIIEGFGNTAAIAKKAGWKGVQIHGAHGYLVSQFLSPLSNLRTDHWGGSVENRARFAIEIYKNIRSKVGPNFPIGIKMNSADFQRGGFTEEESLQVIQMLSAEGIDLIEISGGTYERSAMMGTMKKQSTREREAYFIEFIEKARQITKTPLLLTGGFRTVEVMEEALRNDELDFVGMARPFAVDPNIANQFLSGEKSSIEINPIKTGVGLIDKLGAMEVKWYSAQMDRIGKGKEVKPDLSVWPVIFKMVMERG